MGSVALLGSTLLRDGETRLQEADEHRSNCWQRWFSHNDSPTIIGVLLVD